MATYEVKAYPAFSGYERPEATNLVDHIRRLFIRLTIWSRERRAYYTAFDELQALSDRTLADIGIARSDIPAIARESAKSKAAEY